MLSQMGEALDSSVKLPEEKNTVLAKHEICCLKYAKAF